MITSSTSSIKISFLLHLIMFVLIIILQISKASWHAGLRVRACLILFLDRLPTYPISFCCNPSCSGEKWWNYKMKLCLNFVLQFLPSILSLIFGSKMMFRILCSRYVKLSELSFCKFHSYRNLLCLNSSLQCQHNFWCMQ
jgi:hypothetical protein